MSDQVNYFRATDGTQFYCSQVVGWGIGISKESEAIRFTKGFTINDAIKAHIKICIQIIHTITFIALHLVRGQLISHLGILAAVLLFITFLC